MPVWQDIYSKKNALSDLSEALDRMTEIAEQIDSPELVIEVGRAAMAYERLSTPRQRKPSEPRPHKPTAGQ